MPASVYLGGSKNEVGSAWGLLPPGPGSRILSGTECRTQSRWLAGIPQEGTVLAGLPLTGRSDPGNDREGRGCHGDGGKLRGCVRVNPSITKAWGNTPWECDQHFNQARMRVCHQWKTNASCPELRHISFTAQTSLCSTLGQRNAVGLKELKFAGQ